MNNQRNLEKENKVGVVMLPDIKQYYKAKIIEAIWHCHENRYIDQLSRLESPEINAHLYG